MTGTNKYERDFTEQGHLKRPGRIDLRLFQHIHDVGDGYGGLQYMFHNILNGLLSKFVIEGCQYTSGAVQHGFIMYDGKVVEVDEQTISVSNGEWLYLDSDGTANTTSTENVATSYLLIYRKDSVGNEYDLRFTHNNNHLRCYNLTANAKTNIYGGLDLHGNNLDGVATIDGGGSSISVQDDLDFQNTKNILNLNSLDVNGNIDVDGTANLDEVDIDNTNPVDIAGSLTVHGSIDVDGQSNFDEVDIDNTNPVDISGGLSIGTTSGNLDMNNNNVVNVQKIDGYGTITFDDNLDINNHNLSNLSQLSGYSTNPIVVSSDIQMSASDIDMNGNQINNVTVITSSTTTVQINDDLDLNSHDLDNVVNISGVGTNSITLENNLNMNSKNISNAYDVTILNNIDVGGTANLDEVDIDNSNPVDISGSLTIHTNLDVDGTSNLDEVDIDNASPVNIAGGLSVGTTSGNLNMNNNQINNVSQIDNGGSGITINDNITMSSGKDINVNNNDLNNVNQLLIDRSPSNQTGSGIIANAITGETYSLGDLLAIDGNGKYVKADANGANRHPAVAIALEASTAANQTKKVLLFGFWRNDTDFSTFSYGDIVYMDDTQGSFTNSAPSSAGDFVQVVGVIINDGSGNKVLKFMPDLTEIEIF